MAGLHDMIRREIARRDEGEGKFPALYFILNDGNAAAMTDVQAATKAILASDEMAGAGSGRRMVTITSNMVDAVVAALRAVHPRRFIITHKIVASPRRFEEELDPARLGDGAVDRAAARITALRLREAS